MMMKFVFFLMMLNSILKEKRTWSSTMPLVSGITGLVKVPQGAISGRGVPSGSFKGELGQAYFDVSTSPPTEYVFNGSTWSTAGANPASTTVYGTVLLTDNNQPVATKVYVDAIAIAGALQTLQQVT